MKKILAGILFLFLTFGSCFAEFFYRYGETFTGYIVNYKAQTIEKVTLPFGTNLSEKGRFIYDDGDTIYKVYTHPDSWHKDKVTGKSITIWDRVECEEKSMKEALIACVKNFRKWDCSELLEKIENMEFDD